MKKILFLAVAFLMMAANAVNAQTTKEDLQASQKRIETLQKFVKKAPASTGIADVDAFTSAVYNTALSAVANSELLGNLYYRAIGETKDGVADVTVKKPTVEECVTLGTTITAEVASAKQAADLAKAASEGAKTEKNPLKAAKIAKTLKTSVDAALVLTQESAIQAKAIADIINTVKSANNL